MSQELYWRKCFVRHQALSLASPAHRVSIPPTAFTSVTVVMAMILIRVVHTTVGLTNTLTGVAATLA